MPRTKFKKWSKRYTNYSKKKRKSKKERRKITRSLLWLLDKYLSHISPLYEKYRSKIKPRSHKRYATIRKIKEQQWGQYFNEEKIKDRIVSIDQPHLRPIVRGKEIKKVEFGAKTHNFQIDGISFIDKLSYDNFNECNRFIPTVFKAQKLTGKKVKVAGADKIYQTNKNRNFVSKKGIKTDFKPKGPPLKTPLKTSSGKNSNR